MLLADQAEKSPVSNPSAKSISVTVVASKLAVTDVLDVSVMVQIPVPEQPPPLHPVNVELESAVAVSVTTVPDVYGSEQSGPQSIPAGLLVTVPPPVPVLFTVSVGEDCTLKFAVTDSLAVNVMVQFPVPEHPPPLQPVKVEPEMGAAVSVTVVLDA